MAGPPTGLRAWDAAVLEMSMKGAWNNRKGTTLVEILVVMLILLVGIMTVIQMFPTGFRVVRAAESQTIATKLAQAEVERWKNMPGNLPDGILPIDSTGTVLNDQPPGPPFDGFTASATTGNVFQAGNVLNSRYVRNEVATIPVGSYFTSGAGAAYGSKYTLAFSPIEVTANGSLYDGLSVKSGDLLRRVGDSGSYMYLRPGQYGVDYTLGTSNSNAAFYVTFSYDRNPAHVYYISYSYWVENKSAPYDSTLLSEVDQPVSPDANGDWVPVEIIPPAGYSGYNVTEVEASTDTCARGFVQVTPEGWTTDPYEFALVDSILGVVAFNPRAKNMSEYTARGVRAITARIDYRIYDPRIIREDRIVPTPNEDPNSTGANTHSAIKLALRFILNAGSPNSIIDGDPTDNPDEPTFEGLVKAQLGLPLKNAKQVLVKQSMLIIDLATGLRVEVPPASGAFQPINYKAGVVHLPKYANLIDWNSQVVTGCENLELKGRHLRFFYRADGDWSVQCQKAYSYYLRKWDTTQVDYWHFKLQAPANAGDPCRLLFARCDSGKNVTVDYSYVLDGVAHQVVGKTFRLSDDWVLDANTKCAYVTLDAPAGASIDPAARIVVVGASFRTRVTWRDGKHWRFVDIDTDLTRNSSP
jgi:type II secretory pathway pseudopilin PulG